MKNLKREYYSKAFSHIYVEKAVRKHPRVQRILQRFPEAAVVEITHYKDVFCRSGQQPVLQHQAQALILAEKKGRLIYEGAAVCQSFGHSYFYYTSCVMNCIYDCEYCYLRGMYPSGNIVLFVNLEDVFAEVQELLRQHEVYLCVSYDTDLLALEELAGFVRDWTVFAGQQERLQIEIRTKCARQDLWDSLPRTSQVIYAFTLSPDYVVSQYEQGTPSLAMRVESAKRAVEQGYSVRLCFDPMLYCPDWRETYRDMIEYVFANVSPERLLDVSVGSFRISQDYLKKMRRYAPASPVVQFPYENIKGVYQYPETLRNEMESYLQNELERYLPEKKIFLMN